METWVGEIAAQRQDCALAADAAVQRRSWAPGSVRPGFPNETPHPRRSGFL